MVRCRECQRLRGEAEEATLLITQLECHVAELTRRVRHLEAERDGLLDLLAEVRGRVDEALERHRPLGEG